MRTFSSDMQPQQDAGKDWRGPRGAAFFLCVLLLLGSGCSLLPETTKVVKSPWDSFDAAKASYDRILPEQTSVTELEELGYDPYRTANLEILTYLDIINRFMPNPSIRIENLHPGLQRCIAAKETCRAYEVKLRNVKRKRFGNVLADLFNFRRKTRELGWSFTALIVLEDGMVTYKLYSGTPIIDETEIRKNPLGPIQESEGLLLKLTNGG